MTDFYTASEARDAAIGRKDILAETNFIEMAIQTAIDAGELEAKVEPETHEIDENGHFAPKSMGANPVFYEAWDAPYVHNDDAHKVARQKMDKVIGYFVGLGYVIKRERTELKNAEGVVVSTEAFRWVVSW